MTLMSSSSLPLPLGRGLNTLYVYWWQALLINFFFVSVVDAVFFDPVKHKGYILSVALLLLLAALFEQIACWMVFKLLRLLKIDKLIAWVLVSLLLAAIHIDGPLLWPLYVLIPVLVFNTFICQGDLVKSIKIHALYNIGIYSFEVALSKFLY